MINLCIDCKTRLRLRQQYHQVAVVRLGEVHSNLLENHVDAINQIQIYCAKIKQTQLYSQVNSGFHSVYRNKYLYRLL